MVGHISLRHVHRPSAWDGSEPMHFTVTSFQTGLGIEGRTEGGSVRPCKKQLRFYCYILDYSNRHGKRQDGIDLCANRWKNKYFYRRVKCCNERA